jgi:metal-responsive CopG/Arc/MetJ family transcriptional regulator
MKNQPQTNEYNRYNKEYITIKIPRELLEQCENIVENSNLGFTSRTDVVKTAIRNFLIENNGNNGGDTE